MSSHLVSIITFLPLAGGLFLLALPKEDKGTIRIAGLVISLATFFISLALYTGFDPQGGMQFMEQVVWIPGLDISYLVGIDGISIFLVLLTTFLTPLMLLSTFKAVDTRVKEFIFSLLLLETGILGALVALDLFLFYVFWEIMLIPMYLIIGVFGGQNRIYAAVKFVLFTMVGSLLMLVAILYIGIEAGTFSLLRLYEHTFATDAQMLLFGAFGLAFAIKVPMFPLHTWLPDAHVEAPTAGSVILAGVLLKMGTYGFIRFAMPLFPEACEAFVPYIAILAVVGIIYGALVAMVQPDVKKLVAYSSVSHLGFVMLGLTALTVDAVEGAIYQMLSHGLSTGGLFLIVGTIYERRHTRLIADFGGLARQMPIFATVFMIITLSSIGLPGLNGFVGEFLILAGTFGSTTLPHAPIFAALAATGVILGAVYMLWMIRRVLFGPLTNPKNREIKDLNAREMVYFVPLIVMMVIMGIFPRTFLSKMDRSVEGFLRTQGPAVQASLDHQVALAPVTAEIKASPVQVRAVDRRVRVSPRSPRALDKSARIARPAAATRAPVKALRPRMEVSPALRQRSGVKRLQPEEAP